MTISQFRKTISSFIDLADMLKTYTGMDKGKFLSKDEFFAPLTKSTDDLWIMAEQNNMSMDDMKGWIWDNLSEKVKCSVFQDVGPAGGWPVVKVECCDKTFFFDWVYE